jgi:hypothetical protein
METDSVVGEEGITDSRESQEIMKTDMEVGEEDIMEDIAMAANIGKDPMAWEVASLIVHGHITEAEGRAVRDPTERGVRRGEG